MLNLKAVLIDINGTVLIGSKLIPHALSAIAKLRESSIPFRFISNTTKESKNVLLNHLRSLGFHIEDSEVFTSLLAAKQYILNQSLRPYLVLDDEAIEDFDGVPTDHPNCVLLALAPKKFNFENMNYAFQLLQSGAQLIAVHKGRYYKTEEGLALGPGPFVTALEYACNIQAHVIGKPNETFFELVKNDISSNKRIEYFMIGDDIYDDIDGSQKAGCKGILVKTGKYRCDDEKKIQQPPYAIVDSIHQAIDLIINS